MRPEQPAATAWLARAQLALAAAAVALLFTIVPLSLTGDGHARWTALHTLLHTGELPVTRYSYVGPLFASPLFLFESRQADFWWSLRYNVLLLAAGSAAVWWLLRGVLPPLTRATFVLLLVAGGMMPHHVRDFYGEVFTAVCAAGGLLVVLVTGRSIGWVPVVLGVANAPATAVGLALVAAWRFWQTRRYDGLAAAACVAAIVLGENLLVRGDLLASGYARDHGFRTLMPFSGRPGFSYPMLLGVVSLLFSFGKGLLFFAPGLLMVPYARRVAPRPVADLLTAWLLLVAGILLVYSRWWAWYGGWYWGPRFLLPAVFPSALALALVLTSPAAPLRRLSAVALAVWTVWVGASGAVYGQRGLDICMDNNYALEHLCWYVPEFSPLFRPLAIRTSLDSWQRIWMLLAALSAAALIVPHAWRASEVLPDLRRKLLKRSPPAPSS